METKNIYQKLLAAQQEIGAISKTQDNPFFKSKYADINAILAVVKPILNSNGLVLLQALTTVDGRNTLTTKIIEADTGSHIGNQPNIESSCFLPEMSDPQKQGSAITYFRRYALQSLLALETQDDDGNNASDKTPIYNSYVPKKNSKAVNDFMGDLIPTEEEIILWTEKLEACSDLEELKTVWKTVPPMVQDKLKKLKDTLKYNMA